MTPAKGYRLPREERMKGYRDVELRHFDQFFDEFRGVPVTPVAVELRPNAECLTEFEHPENPLYVFGPEDGTLGRGWLEECHRFVVIPTAIRSPLNLAAAANVVLYDRACKVGMGAPELEAVR